MTVLNKKIRASRKLFLYPTSAGMSRCALIWFFPLILHCVRKLQWCMMSYFIIFFAVSYKFSYSSNVLKGFAEESECWIRGLRASSCTICLHIALFTNCTASSNLPWSVWCGRFPRHYSQILRHILECLHMYKLPGVTNFVQSLMDKCLAF